MEFLKSLFPSQSLELCIQRVYGIGIDLSFIMAFEESFGIIAISNSKVFLLNLEVWSELQVELSEFSKFLIIECKLWVWNGNCGRIWDLKSLKCDNIDILVNGQCLLEKYKDMVIIGTDNGQIHIYKADGISVKILKSSISTRILDVGETGDFFIIGQESLISCWDLDSGNKIKEFVTTGLVKITTLSEKDKIAGFSKDSITIYRLKESWIAKKPLKFELEFKDLKQAFWIGSTLITVESDKISAFDLKKDLQLLAQIYVKVSGKVFLKTLEQEIHLLVHEESDIYNLVYSNQSWEKMCLKVSSIEFSKLSNHSQKVFSSFSDSLIGDFKPLKNEISLWYSSNNNLTNRKTWDLLAMHHDHICEIWDPWLNQVLERIDFSNLFGKTNVDRIILNQRSLVVIGGPRILIYKFISSVDIDLSNKMEDDLEKAMENLDQVVDSALEQAIYVQKLLKNTKSEDLEPMKNQTEKDLLDEPLIPSKTINSCTVSKSSGIYTIGNMIVEKYDYTAVKPGWYSICSIINNDIINNFIVDLENDLMAINSHDLQVGIGRITNLGILKSLAVQGGKSIAHLSFANLFLSSETEISNCIICITTDGTINAIKIAISDTSEISSLSNIIIQKKISESPVDVFVLVENHIPHNSASSNEQSLICVFTQSIRIFSFRENNLHSLIQEKRLDSKYGLVLKSGLFHKESKSYLAILFSSGILQVFTLPDLSSSLKDRLISNIKYISDSFISPIGLIYVWPTKHQLEVFEITASRENEKSQQNVEPHRFNSNSDIKTTENSRENLKRVIQKNKSVSFEKKEILAGISRDQNSNPGLNHELHQKMNERGEALKALETKFGDISSGTSEFLKKIKDYNDQQVNTGIINYSQRKNGGNCRGSGRATQRLLNNGSVCLSIIKMSVDPSKTNYADYDDETSSSSEDEVRFGFWGAGGGSSGSLSKQMAKKEREANKNLKKELAAKREADLAKEKAEIAKTEASKAEIAKAEAAIKLEEQKQVYDSNLGWSQNSIKSQQTASSQTFPSQAIQPAQTQPYIASQGSHPDLVTERLASSNHSREQIYNSEEPKRAGYGGVDNSAFNNAMIAAYVTQAMNNVSAAAPFANRAIPREEFDVEPELLDSIPASKILRRLGAYRNWSDQEIQSDLNVLEFHRLRSVKDLRELSLDSWKEIKELLPLVKALLIKEVNKGRTTAYVRSDVPIPNHSANSSFIGTETPQETKNIRAPTSTPMDSPDLSQARRGIQGRQW